MGKPNWMSGATGAVGGAAAGAPLGPYGMLAGSLIGGGAGLYSGTKEPKLKNQSNFDPYQQGIHQQQGEALQGGGGYAQLIKMLQDMTDPNSDFHKAYEDQQMGQFNEVTIPGIGERFGGGYGANSGALSSSGFGQALGGAAAGLQRDLAANKMNTIKDALQRLTGEYGKYQDRNTFDREETPGQSSILETLLPALIQAMRGYNA